MEDGERSSGRRPWRDISQTDKDQIGGGWVKMRWRGRRGEGRRESADETRRDETVERRRAKGCGWRQLRHGLPGGCAGRCTARPGLRAIYRTGKRKKEKNKERRNASKEEEQTAFTLLAPPTVVISLSSSSDTRLFYFPSIPPGPPPPACYRT